jgi:hypothetical protein
MGRGRFATYVLLCQEEYKEWNGVHLQSQLGCKRTGLNICQIIVTDILIKKAQR